MDMCAAIKTICPTLKPRLISASLGQGLRPGLVLMRALLRVVTLAVRAQVRLRLGLLLQARWRGRVQV